MMIITPTRQPGWRAAVGRAWRSGAEALRGVPSWLAVSVLMSGAATVMAWLAPAPGLV